MPAIQHFDLTWATLTERVERTGRWTSWVAAEPVLADLGGLDEVMAMAQDRAAPSRANALLAALVRLGAADGGNDLEAAQAVALLLSKGTARLGRQLRNLSKDIDEMVVGQVWLQIREFPWRQRRRAIAQNILMDARRAVLRDLGVDTRKSSKGVVVVLVDTASVRAATDRGSLVMAPSGGFLVGHDPGAGLGDEPTLLGVLQWATGNGVVTDEDAGVLLELAALELAWPVHGLNSAAELAAVATRRGVNARTVSRSRDRAVRSLVSARAAYLRECA